MASNISGFKSPVFTSLASDFQPFSFYANYLTFINKAYLNPFSKEGLNKYNFYIEDTTYYQSDTVFIISFAPIKSTFEALEGQAYIHLPTYAIINVSCSANDRTSKWDWDIQQNYIQVEGKWFPNQLHANIFFKDYDLYGQRLKAIQRSYLSNIEIDPELTGKQFSSITLDLSLEENNLALLEQLRPIPLDEKENNTFNQLDSLAKKMKLRQIEFMMQAIITQKIPVSILNIDLDKIIRFNRYEGFRLGAGITTNQRFSKVLELGAYSAYGFRDKAIKYGGVVKLYKDRERNQSLKFAYSNDVAESGESMLVTSMPQDNDFNRYWQTRRFDKIETYQISIATTLWGNTNLEIGTSYKSVNPRYDYQYLMNTGEPLSGFEYAMMSLKLSYARKRRIINIAGVQIPAASSLPILGLALERSFSTSLINHTGINYTKLEGTVRDRLNLRGLGTFSFNLKAGFVNRSVPVHINFVHPGTATSDYFVANVFGTMDVNEFVSDRFVNAFLTHNFGNVFINHKLSKPELLMHHNVSFSKLIDKESHQNISVTATPRGYYESGLSLNNLIRINYVDVAYLGIGISGFIRHGPYAFEKLENNLFFKWQTIFTF